MSEPTPRPWRIEPIPDSPEGRFEITDAGWSIAENVSKPHAELIVRCVNHFDELVAALEHVHAMIERHRDRRDGDPAQLIYPELDPIADVLARARGEEPT